MDKVINFFFLLRPGQWVKNIFVFAGLLFSTDFANEKLLFKVILTAFSFCLVSSCVYILNDLLDLEIDRLHPKKKYRPLAAEKIAISTGIATSIGIGLMGLSLGWVISWSVALILLLYILINIFYSLWLKTIVLVDVFCISAGFMLRIFAGTVGVGIPPSKWLLLCGFMITLFLGFAKRRAELMTNSPSRREVLKNYSPLILDEILAICATSAIITYSLYTMSAETVKIHHTNNLIYTVPFVVYGIFRYIYLLHKRSGGEHPARDLVTDPHIVASVICWGVLTFFLVMRPYT